MVNDWVVGARTEIADRDHPGVKRYATAMEAQEAQQRALRDCMDILKARGFVAALAVLCETETIQGDVVPSAAASIMAFTEDALDGLSDVMEYCIPDSRAHIRSLQAPPAEGASDEQA